jgi:O-acetyl-ADP-ribose deacetylase
MNQSIRYRGCGYCKHYRADGGCIAFDPVLMDITIGYTKHTVPILGQANSIVYEDCGKSITHRILDEMEKHSES